jgi:hypothetical protein
MRGQLVGLGVVGWCAIVACGGSDNTMIDGGSDGTTDGANNNDAGNGSDSGNKSDSGNTDAGNGNDSGNGNDAGALFPCGPMTCDSASQYCHLQEVGPQPADGGFNGSATCPTYPGSCGATPSCGCIPVLTMCSCAQSGSDITDTCGGV